MNKFLEDYKVLTILTAVAIGFVWGSLHFTDPIQKELNELKKEKLRLEIKLHKINLKSL